MLLKYETEVLKETQKSSFILISAFGIELSNIIDINISLYLNKYSLVFLLNFENSFDINNEYFRNLRNLDKFTRNKLYKKGGVFMCTNRVLITDFLEQNVDLSKVSALIIKNADKIYEDSLDAFIIYIYKKFNRNGIIKAFSNNCIPFSYGVNCLEKFVNILCTNNLILYPRFHLHIESTFTKEIEYKEYRLSMTSEMIELQMILIEILKELIKINGLDVDYELLLISDMFLNKKIKDIYDLKFLINTLISCNQSTFFIYLEHLINNQIDLGKESTWINSKFSQILLDKLDLFQKNNQNFIELNQNENNKKIKIEKNQNIIQNKLHISEKVYNKRIIKNNILHTQFFNKNVENDVKKEDNINIKQFQKNLDPKKYNKKFIKFINIINESIEEVIFVVVNFIFTKKDIEDAFSKINNFGLKKIYFFTRQKFLNLIINIKNSNILYNLNKYVNDSKDVSEIYKNSHKHLFKKDDGNIALVRNNNSIDDDENIEILYKNNVSCINHNFLKNEETNSIQTDDIYKNSFDFEEKYSDYFCNDEEIKILHLKIKQSHLIILYDLDISVLRKCEYLGTKMKIRVESIVYKDSVEEQKYLNSVRREKMYFEQLIEKRRKLPLNLELDKIVLEEDSSEEDFKYNIVVDTRELRSQLPFYLYKSNNQLTISTLKIGDYLLNENICIERKNIYDLISSIKTGRLYIQARMFTYFYNQHFILIEFNNRPCFSDFYNHSQETFKNSLISKFCLFLMTFPTTKILWSENCLFSAKLFRRLQKKELVSEIISNIDPTLHEILLSIPGINQFNINKIKKYFLNLKELINCPRTVLISKMGEYNGELIYSFFNNKLESNIDDT